GSEALLQGYLSGTRRRRCIGIQQGARVSGEMSSGLDAEFLDDFFAEAEQHLVSVRQSLLQLEGSIREPEPDPKVLGELFQNIHSFKGISAIAGLAPAESLAHAAEEFLRRLTRRQGNLNEKGLEVLMEVAQKLEQMVGAFRSGKPTPGYESLVAVLKQQYEQSVQPQVTTKDKQPSDPVVSSSIGTMKQPERSQWKFTFVPSRELEAEGITIDSVREELSRVGEILKASPSVKDNGELSFELMVVAENAPSDMAGWEAKGIRAELEPVEEATGLPGNATPS